VAQTADTADMAGIANPGRMLADGIPWPDFAVATTALPEGLDWFDFWGSRADTYERLGREALQRGDTLSAGDWLWHASLSWHYAQFMWFHDPARREAGQRRKADLYREAAPYLAPPAERVDVPIDHTAVPGYLRLPVDGEGPFPCVLILGGLESTKEESLLFENLCLQRGLATLAMDGPGQGEMFFDVGLAPDFERYASAMIDALVARPEIDGERIGVVGRSLGGYYAVRSASCDPRLKACVAWGACFDISDLDDMPAHTRRGFLYVTRKESEEEAREQLRRSMDLRDVIGGLDRPTYVLHGVHDTIFSMRQVELLQEHVAPGVLLEVDVEQDGDHCAHNMAAIVRPRMADWIARQLRAGR
jgi:2,6-dihydroxypseudooxynicotine hydrolase